MNDPCPCGALRPRSEVARHAETCDVLQARVNRVAALRSLVLGGALQNPELVLFGTTPPSQRPALRTDRRTTP